MIKIFIENLKFKTVIGILEKERKTEQQVVLDIEISYDPKEGFVDYALVCEISKNLLRSEKFELVEEAVISLAAELKERFDQISSIEISLKKIEILSDCVVGATYSKTY